MNGSVDAVSRAGLMLPVGLRGAHSHYSRRCYRHRLFVRVNRLRWLVCPALPNSRSFVKGGNKTTNNANGRHTSYRYMQ